MISVVCVYNNEVSLQNNLLRSLAGQTARYDLILVDNTKGTFKSAAAALNWGGRRANGKYIMFVHQDVLLGSDLWLEEAEELLDNLATFGIAGVAGKSENARGVITNSRRGALRQLAGKVQINRPTEAQTLDECLVVIPRMVFDVLQFDEKTCDGWHLYAVDYCLACERLGFHVYVIPTVIYHKPDVVLRSCSRLEMLKGVGGLPRSYYSTIGTVLKKHRDRHRRVYTTCGDWRTSYPVILQRIMILANAGLRLLLSKVRVGRQK